MYRSAVMLLLLAVSGSGAAFVAAKACSADPAVPAALQGVWARNGRCDLVTERFTVTAHAAAWGRDPPAHVIYDAEDAAIEWVEEGVVDNFVLGPKGDILVHNIQGFGMPQREGLARCGRAMSRASWPPKGVAH